MDLKTKRVSITILLLLIFNVSCFLFVMGHSVSQPSTDMLEGDVTFVVDPDMSVMVGFVGSFEQAMFPYEGIPPIYDLKLNQVTKLVDTNLVESTGNFVIKINPLYSEILSVLDLDIDASFEELESTVNVLINMPGYVAVDGTLNMLTNEETLESDLDLDLTLSLWYDVYPKEMIEQFTMMFPMLKSQLAYQLSEATLGNLTLQDLSLEILEMGPESAELAVKCNISGDFTKGMVALSSMMAPVDIDLPSTGQVINPEVFKNIKPRSASVSLSFDKEELAFIGNFEGLLEGDLDELINIIKNDVLEDIIDDPGINPEDAHWIKDLFLPSEYSFVNLNLTLKYSFDGAKHSANIAVEGLGLKPPSTQSLMLFLEEASVKYSNPEFTITFEGGSDEKEYVEIDVPDSTTEPILKEPQKVVWKFDNISNLDLVSFKVQEHKRKIGIDIRVAGAIVAGAVVVAAVGFLMARKR